MSVWGLFRVKNEADIIEASVTRMLAQVDHVVVMDGSTDETTEILNGLPVTVIRDDTPTYEQPQQMTALAQIAREGGARWVIPADADEVWIARQGTIKETLEALPPEALIASAPLYNHVATALDDPNDPDPVSRIQWRRPEPVPLPKVACRALDDLSIHFGQHGASYGDPHPLTVTDALEVRHYPYRNSSQLIRKIEVGAPPLMESSLPESIGAHWRGFGKALRDEGPQSLEAWFDQWAWSDDPEADADLVHDPCP